MNSLFKKEKGQEDISHIKKKQKMMILAGYK